MDPQNMKKVIVAQRVWILPEDVIRLKRVTVLPRREFRHRHHGRSVPTPTLPSNRLLTEVGYSVLQEDGAFLLLDGYN